MDKKLSIKLKIANRSYPLHIERKQEEMIRKAAKMLDDKVLQYKQQYKGQDNQDFLAMAALQYVIGFVELENKTDMMPVYNELKAMESELAEFLEQE